KPVETSVIVHARKRQDFILSSEELAAAGHVLDAEDERLNFGADDRIYVRLQKPAKPGALFDIFRPSRTLYHPETKKPVGVLVMHLGRAKILSRGKGDVWRAVIVESFAEIQRGDRLQPAHLIPPKLAPKFLAGDIEGRVPYIRDDATEAGQNQVIGIDLGTADGMQPGVVLSVHQRGRTVEDVATREDVRLPEEKIAEIMVLVPQKRASIAIVRTATAPVHVGDIVRNEASR
ncbi:MAG: peptidoglycan-binding protein LysM, partial [Zetaproteobacteria bacterium]